MAAMSAGASPARRQRLARGGELRAPRSRADRARPGRAADRSGGTRAAPRRRRGRRRRTRCCASWRCPGRGRAGRRAWTGRSCCARRSRKPRRRSVVVRKAARRLLGTPARSRRLRGRRLRRGAVLARHVEAAVGLEPGEQLAEPAAHVRADPYQRRGEDAVAQVAAAVLDDGRRRHDAGAADHVAQAVRQPEHGIGGVARRVDEDRMAGGVAQVDPALQPERAHRLQHVGRHRPALRFERRGGSVDQGRIGSHLSAPFVEQFDQPGARHLVRLAGRCGEQLLVAGDEVRRGGGVDDERGRRRRSGRHGSSGLSFQ